MSSAIIPIVATIIALGVAAQVLADRLQVPSVLFLIFAGIVVGPEVLGVVTIESFGGVEPLAGVVGLSVAIIVFEGAFHLKASKLREAPGATLRLVTIGAVISLVGTSLAVHYLLDARWDVSFLVGSLLVATGPTVITPILEVVPVRDRVGAALETEGVVNDVTAAILAIVVFQVVVNPDLPAMAVLQDFMTRLGVGVLVGLVVAAVIWYLLRHVDLSRGNAPQSARLIVLAGALVSYGAANTLRGEAGIAAVATAGMVLGNANLPYEEEIESFKGDVTLVVLSFVFIALAALLSFDDLTQFGLAGLAAVVVIAAIVRPIAVYLSTYGGRYSWAERTFMSAVGPRGIIPASVATLFAVELQNVGMEAAASLLVGIVFLTILLTVVFEGGLARHIAEALDVIPMRVIIVGGGTVGRALAERLEDRGENVVIVERDVSMVERARNEGFTVYHGDGTDTDELRSAGWFVSTTALPGWQPPSGSGGRRNLYTVFVVSFAGLGNGFSQRMTERSEGPPGRSQGHSAIGASQKIIAYEPTTRTTPTTASANNGDTWSEMMPVPSWNGMTARPLTIAIELRTVARPSVPMRSLTY